MRIPWIFAVALGFSVLGLVCSDSDRVVCYYTNWSAYRPGLGKFVPQNINPYLCTHLIYAFGGFGNDFKMKPFDKWQDIDQGGYAKFNGLKAHNKNLKTLIAIGGWNEGSKRFSKLVADPEARQTFIKSAIAYMRQHRFDGLDLDWEYPASRDGSKPADKQNYALFVRELRDAFENEASGKRPRLLLTMAVPAGLDTIDKGYDVASLNEDLDFFNILSYDYHTAAEFEVNHHAPLRALASTSDFDPNIDLNIEATLKYYLKNGATSDKLVVGIPTYGRAFKLINPGDAEIGSPAEGPAEAGKVTREKGYLAYYEICEKIGAEGWLIEKPEPNAVGPYAYKEYEWVGYDDEDMVARKAEYVVENRLGGIMFWAIDNDDFRGTCTGQKYPLIEAGKAALAQATKPQAPVRKTPNRISGGSQETSGKKPSGASSLRRPAASLSAGNRKSATTTTTTTTTRRPKVGAVKNSAFSTTTTPEPPTTPDTAVEFTCTEEGFFPHPRDCKKYFWCLEAANVGLVTHTFTCPAGLHFNKFTDSCDYATNVLCSKPAAATTPKPLLGQSTSLATRPPTTTTTTTTTTPEPEPDYYDEEEVPAKEEPVDLSSPADLRKLLQLIEDLGGVSAVRRLLEENTRGSQGAKKQGAEEIQLTSAQRQALAQVIGTSEPEAKPKSRPSLSRKPAADDEGATPASPTPKKYVTLSRQRTTAQAVEEEEQLVNEEETPLEEEPPTTTLRTSQNRPANKYVTLLRQRQQTAQVAREEVGIQDTENNEESLLTSQRPVEVAAEAQGTSRAPPPTTTTISTTTTTTTEAATTSSIPPVADIVDVDTAQSEIFTKDEVEEEPEILASSSTTTTTTLATTPTTTPRPRSTTTTRTTSRPSTTPSPDTRRPRPFRPSPRLPSTTTTSTTTTPRTKAPIRITVKPVVRPIDDEFIRIEDPDQQDAILGGSAASEQQQQQQAIGLPNGNVVEIDEEGNVYCFDAGTFPYPEECKKFIQCARMESGELRGWIYTCPRNLTFDPVGGICNWGSPLRCRTL